MRSRAFSLLTFIGSFCLGGTFLGCAGDTGGSDGGGPNGSGTGGGTPGSGGAVGSGGEGTASGGASTGGTASGGAGTGGAGTGGAGTGGGAGTDCSSLPLCTDFESDAAGSVPAGFTANLNYNSGTNPTNVTVTTEDAYRGSQSVKVIGIQDLYGIEYANPGDTFYLRTWLKVVGLTNGNPAIVGVGQDPSNEMRMRLLKNGVNDFHAVAANASLGGDGISPVNSNGGLPCDDCVPLPEDWFCLEMYVDKTSETLQMWVDGEQAVDIVNNAPWSGGAEWPASMDVLRIGSMSLQGGGATVFIDDVALGPSRIGCE